MRTTLTLDPDVAVLVRREMARKGSRLKAVVNSALRAGLRGKSAGSRTPRRPYRIKPHNGGRWLLPPGIESTSRMLAATEGEAFR